MEWAKQSLGCGNRVVSMSEMIDDTLAGDTNGWTDPKGSG
jgi:hypothetical protein